MLHAWATEAMAYSLQNIVMWQTGPCARTCEVTGADTALFMAGLYSNPNQFVCVPESQYQTPYPKGEASNAAYVTVVCFSFVFSLFQFWTLISLTSYPVHSESSQGGNYPYSFTILNVLWSSQRVFWNTPFYYNH